MTFPDPAPSTVPATAPAAPGRGPTPVTAPVPVPVLPDGVDPAWLPPTAFRALGTRRTLLRGTGPLVDTVHGEVAAACARFGGSVVRAPVSSDVPYDADSPHGPYDANNANNTDSANNANNTDSADGPYDLVLELAGTGETQRELGGEGFVVARAARSSGTSGSAPEGAGHAGPVGAATGTGTGTGTTTVTAAGERGLLYGLFHVVRLGEDAFRGTGPREVHRPALPLRMLDHWDNVAVHPVMGQVERGYAGGSLFWRDGAARGDLERVRAYARLLAATGVNAVSVNNVNVHATEARLLTDRIGEVAAPAAALRAYGIRTHLSVSFAAPVVLGGLATADPLDEGVRRWWAEAVRRVYEVIPDFGGFVVKADSEGQPGPFTYGRTHADGANMLAAALAPYGGTVHWRAFVYNHRQDWRDRSTDRARAAYDHFAPLDGAFADNAVLQVKHGPMDFQPREPVSPVIAALPRTRLAVELQVTQEYTGQQKHACWLGPMWSETLRFRPAGGTGPAVGALSDGGLVAVSNAGDDPFWTGHPLAQANLYTFGRLAWQPDTDPVDVLDEWIRLTFTPDRTAAPDRLRTGLHAVLDDSWRTYEKYTAPLGVGWMVQTGHHYGPSVDGYEYSPWGTYHFADRDGIGVDRTAATGTGFAAQFPKPWSDTYESLADCPDELLLFFHHVPYGHVLHSGSTVLQHIYDTHFEGVEEAEAAARTWATLSDLVDDARHARVTERYEEQLRSAREWRDQINSYFLRKSGVADERGRPIH